jgi:hypothetical protein
MVEFLHECLCKKLNSLYYGYMKPLCIIFWHVLKVRMWIGCLHCLFVIPSWKGPWIFTQSVHSTKTSYFSCLSKISFYKFYLDSHSTKCQMFNGQSIRWITSTFWYTICMRTSVWWVGWKVSIVHFCIHFCLNVMISLN